VVRGLEFVIPSGVLEQRLDRRRRVVNGRLIQADDALIGPRFKSWSEFEPRRAAFIDVHEVHPRDGNLTDDLLPPPAVPAREQ
jgi:hypothetical protein